ncbi:hypothetical protein V5799_024289, partial [Amblyomma americanum]
TYGGKEFELIPNTAAQWCGGLHTPGMTWPRLRHHFFSPPHVSPIITCCPHVFMLNIVLTVQSLVSRHLECCQQSSSSWSSLEVVRGTTLTIILWL